MRILIKECVHVGVKRALSGHLVKTVAEIGWRSSQDGSLLTKAQDELDVFVTIDRNLERQQNLAKRKRGIVIERVSSKEIGDNEPLLSNLKRSAENVGAGQVIHVRGPLSKT